MSDYHKTAAQTEVPRDPSAEPCGANRRCIFCLLETDPRICGEYGSVVAMKDDYPVSEHHMLVLPKRHTVDYFSLTATEKRDADCLLELLRQRIMDMDPTVTGFNIGMNCGKSAGQSVFHCHIHLIPRRDGDTQSPKGGVRGVIPDKMGY